MAELKLPRLLGAAKEFNVGQDTLIDYLIGKGYPKDELKPTDLVVVIFHDHGSRYVGKLYNDEWMRDRQFLDEETKDITAASIVGRKQFKKFVTVSQGQTIGEAINIMKDLGISQMPVVNNEQVVGSVTEHSLLSHLLDGAERNQKLNTVMGKPFPFVEWTSTSKDISSRISRENSAVLVKDIAGVTHIITEYDLIQAIAG